MPHCGAAVIVLDRCTCNAVFLTKLSNASSQGSPLRINVPWHGLSLAKACPMPRKMGRLGIDIKRKRKVCNQIGLSFEGQNVKALFLFTLTRQCAYCMSVPPQLITY